ncbi:ester cyclase [Natrarchaeobius oligotrophus]|uniref:Ester cyclase n=1 Tax=Natrarchaeobius chitinivorans TaxID=1679083 RepID=A0A3N6MWR3_NATCH|nr:ester cyclase [Natrarchaeobius chitinivorans]RQH00842.1 ester cyclase [Natrarchaeobius chitinivorans]
MSTMEAENKELAQKYAEEVVTEGHLDIIDEIIADEHVQHTSAVSETLHGPEEVKENVSMLREAFPDTECVVQDLIADGDMVVRRDRATCTHEGEFMGIEPTGKEIEIQGVHIHRIEDGQIAETWSQSDMMGAMAQLGAIEPPGE